MTADLLYEGRRQAPERMIESAQIKRFRGFSDAKVDACSTINIVVGENGAGKTSFLEALFLALGASPEVALRLKNWRGLTADRLHGSPAQIDDAMWRDLFHRFDQDKSVLIALKGSPDNSRSVTISFNGQHDVHVPLSAGSSKEKYNLNSVAPVSFKWKGPKNIEYVARPHIEDGQFKVSAGPKLPAEVFFFAANHTYSAEETAGRFSELSKKFRADEMTSLFKQHFDNVEELSIEMMAGAAMVYAKARGLPERVPINLLSSGMSKLASILFAIPAQRGGVVLIDEIENGLYYKRLPLVWSTLHRFCKKYDTQVFASTHSAECLRAAADVAKEHTGDFSVIHVESKGGATELRQFSGEKFAMAIDSDLEIR